METLEQKRQALKLFFTTSTAAFSIQRQVQEMLGGTLSEKAIKMNSLHQEALDLLNGNEPLIPEAMDTLLAKMEILAGSPDLPMPNFPKGGITAKTN